MDFVEVALRAALLVAWIAPALGALVCGIVALGVGARPREDRCYAMVSAGLIASLAGSVIVAGLELAGLSSERSADFGSWLRVGNYEVPAVFLIDRVAVVFSILAASLTMLIARFSRTYLHKELGFVRFFILLGMFASGVQLVAWAGALDVMFAGWELIGLSSAMFIGFFHERSEPIRSSVRAFATYRLCDAGFLLAIVFTHELLGSTRLDVLPKARDLSAEAATAMAALFLFSALGKSAQLPFSGWLARAMEGPTPSSALFYGGVSVHAGLYLLLRIWPVLEVAPAVRIAGVLFGMATAVYASLVARAHSDAKGALAHATLAQVGLILAEISAGFTTLALIHLVGHALLRVWQYLRAPNTIHDAHRIGHRVPAMSWMGSRAPALAARVHAHAIHRFRLDERIDVALAPLLAATRLMDRMDRRFRAVLSIDKDKV